jgi:hypothetical protein
MCHRILATPFCTDYTEVAPAHLLAVEASQPKSELVPTTSRMLAKESNHYPLLTQPYADDPKWPRRGYVRSWREIELHTVKLRYLPEKVF